MFLKTQMLTLCATKEGQLTAEGIEEKGASRWERTPQEVAKKSNDRAEVSKGMRSIESPV